MRSPPTEECDGLDVRLRLTDVLLHPTRMMQQREHVGRVLIVEDDLATRVGLCELLERAGYTCTAAGSLDEALNVLTSFVPDVLITDVRLGAFNGLELVIREAGVIPSIVMTGFADSTLEETARAFGATFLLKPIAPSALLEHVASALMSRASRNESTSRRRDVAEEL